MKLKINKYPKGNEILPEFFKILVKGKIYLQFLVFTIIYWLYPSLSPPELKNDSESTK